MSSTVTLILEKYLTERPGIMDHYHIYMVLIDYLLIAFYQFPFLSPVSIVSSPFNYLLITAPLNVTFSSTTVYSHPVVSADVISGINTVYFRPLINLSVGTLFPIILLSRTTRC